MAFTQEYLPNGLILHQDDTFFKLGQDSTLLAYFSKIRRGARVLDLGCGTGALALLAYRPDLKITGLELQAEALALFQKSIEANGVTIDTVCGDLREIRSLLPHGCMDHVLCNPPYFGVGRGRAAAAPQHALARQDSTCSIEELALALAHVLRSGGKCSLVFRPERLWALLTALSRVLLVPKRLRFVHQTAESAPSAVLVECRKGGSAEGLIVEPPLLVCSNEYEKIYHPKLP